MESSYIFRFDAYPYIFAARSQRRFLSTVSKFLEKPIVKSPSELSIALGLGCIPFLGVHMEVGSVSGGAPLQAQVGLQKKQQNQQEKVVNTLLDSTKASAPDGKKLLAVA